MTDLCERFKVYIVNQLDQRAGEVDDFTSLKAKQVWNDVGTWTMEISRVSRNLVALTTPMYGIDIWDTLINKSFCRGLIDTREQKYDAMTDTLTITGWDDNQWLNWRLAHPSPAEMFPPYTTQSYDVRTGQASNVIHQYADVNLGFAAIPARQITTVLSYDAGVGATITGRARWQPMLTFCQDLALQGGPTVGFKIDRYAPTGEKQFITYGSVDRTDSVKFSVSMGNLVGGTIKSTSPKATYVFAAGSGDLTARAYHESYDAGQVALWGRREYFLDSNSTSVDAELSAAGQKTLLEQGEQAEFTLNITDTEGITYGVDYALGDLVTGVFVGNEPTPVLTNDGAVEEAIREVELSLSATECRITPTMGSPERKDVFRIFRQIRELRTQLKNRQNN